MEQKVGKIGQNRVKMEQNIKKMMVMCYKEKYEHRNHSSP